MLDIVKRWKKITEFSMEDCLSLPGLGCKYFISLGTEEDEPIYTYNDKYMRHFMRQGIRVCAFNHYYESEICDDFFKIISEQLNVKQSIYKTIEAYLEYKNKH